jgi:hypothetical protein
VGISPSESGGASLPPRLDTSSAHSARVWNYLLGGKDNISALVFWLSGLTWLNRGSTC